MTLVLYYGYNYLACKDVCQGVSKTPSAGVRGSTAGSGQGGQKPRAGGLEGCTVPRTLARACLGAQTRDCSAWRDRSWHERAR